MFKLVARNVLLVCLVGISVCGPICVAAGKERPSAPETTPDWTLKLEGAVNWQRVTPLGHLIVSSTSGLYGVDPVAGKVQWRHADLRNLAEASYRPILNTQLVLVEDERIRDRVLILDTMGGRIAFDSQSAGISQVLSSHVLVRGGSLLIFGLQSGNAATSMLLLDIDSGKIRWTNDDLFADQPKLLRFAAALVQAATDSSGVTDEPVEIGPEAFLLASGTGVSRVNSRTGEFDWQIPAVRNADRTKVYFTPDRPSLFFAAGEVVSSSETTAGLVYTYYQAFRTDDGAPVWKKPIKLKGSARHPIFLEQGVALSSAPDGSGKLKLARYDSGESIWGKKGKGIDIKGTVVDHQLIAEGILLTMGHDSAWTNRGVEYFLNVVDPRQGVFRFKKSHKMRGRLLGTETLPKGVLYLTTSEINVLDLATGAPLHGPVVSDGSLATAEHDGKVYAFSQNEGALYVLDKQRGSLSKLSKAKVALSDKDVVDRLEVGRDRLTLISSQNIVAFGMDGAVLFHTHHAAPRHPTWLRALYTATAVRAAMASAASGVYSGALAQASTEEELGPVGKEIATELSRGYGQLAEGYAGLSRDYFHAASQRFKASAASQDFVFMMIKSPEKGVDLARVSKETGEIVDRIVLKRNRDPMYEVDAIANRVYYEVNPGEIAGFLF